MLIKYKLKALTFYEDWFSLKPCSMYKIFIVYRGSKINKKTFYIKKKKWTLVSDLTLDEDEIKQQFTSTFRNQINKVKKNLDIKIIFDGININEFLEFYNRQFAKAKNLAYLKKYQLEKFNNKIFFISGYFEDKLTNMQAYIYDENQKKVRLLHSASIIHVIEDNKKRNIVGWINKALHFETMKCFKKLEYKEFDWGGYGNDESNKATSGIDKFKDSFGGKKIKLYDYYSISFYILSKIKEFIK